MSSAESRVQVDDEEREELDALHARLQLLRSKRAERLALVGILKDEPQSPAPAALESSTVRSPPPVLETGLARTPCGGAGSPRSTTDVPSDNPGVASEHEQRPYSPRAAEPTETYAAPNSTSAPPASPSFPLSPQCALPLPTLSVGVVSETHPLHFPLPPPPPPPPYSIYYPQSQALLFPQPSFPPLPPPPPAAPTAQYPCPPVPLFAPYPAWSPPPSAAWASRPLALELETPDAQPLPLATRRASWRERFRTR